MIKQIYKLMKKDLHHLDKWRTQHPPYFSPQGATYGAFVIPHQGIHLRIIASDGMGEASAWEHVSCHAYDPHFNKARCPKWNEMCHIASLFWNDDEVIMQLRPAKADYVNMHEFVLHWWKPVGVPIPQPPRILV